VTPGVSPGMNDRRARNDEELPPRTLLGDLVGALGPFFILGILIGILIVLVGLLRTFLILSLLGALGFVLYVVRSRGRRRRARSQ